MAQVTGKVKWFDVKKGYGYLVDNNGNDFFVHHSGIAVGRTYVGLKDGEEVTFDVVQGEKGMQAADVKITAPVKRFHKKNHNTTEAPVEAEVTSEAAE